jgi:hypothetical protein
MKKTIFITMAVIATFGLIMVSCEKDNSSKHHYTKEELEEIHRQDSLKKIIPVDYVFTQNVTVPVNKGYEGVTVCLTPDTNKLLELFQYNSVAELVAALGTIEGGVQTGNDITFYAYNYSTKYEYTSPSTTNSFGHWFDANGDVCSWGDQAYLFCEKQDTFSLKFTLGLFPDRPALGSVYKIVEAMKLDNFKVAFMFTVTIGPEEVLETTIVGTQTIDLDVPLIDWTAAITEFDVGAITTALGIAPEDATLMAVQGDGSLYTGGWTASFGFFFNSSGNVCSWDAEGCTYYVEYYSDSQTIGVGLHPEAASVGQTYTGRVAFVNEAELLQYNIVINITIVEPEENPYPETTVVDTIPIAFSTPIYNDYTPTAVEFDTMIVYQAIGCGPTLATLYGYNETTDSLYINGFTGNNGFWFTLAGDVCSWGDEGVTMDAEYVPKTTTINVFQYPDACLSGQTYKCTLAFVHEGNQINVMITMTMQ